MLTSPPFGDLTFLSKGDVTFLPQGPGCNAVTLRLIQKNTGPNEIGWLVRNTPGLMTRAGYSALEPAHVGPMFALEVFPDGAEERARYLANYTILRDALSTLAGVARVPNWLLVGTLTAPLPDGRPVTLCAALVEVVTGVTIAELEERASVATNSPLAEIVHSLRRFRLAMRNKGISFGNLRPDYFALPFDSSTREEDEDYVAFDKCVALIDWRGMTHVKRVEDADEERFRRDFHALEDMTSMILRYSQHDSRRLPVQATNY
ncbi:hypothetical protein FA95DRAFT_1221598 [Auriscalpium vulgare]|uniref:Uncharacterized protein n=1 Tax=Auriscalpium vulgare TaxID=40419 RepID=A0ACB8R3V3_9AGAM|nr:hypothetical protein FA95DRAFT_1221598 [Auriscalpium vulgare]